MTVPVVQSVGTYAGGVGDTVTITAPTGIAVGDLLIAACSVVGTSSNGQNWARSGWTSIFNNQINNGINDMAFRALYKIADSGDAAASDFAFTISSASFVTIGGMLRITGQHASSFISTDIQTSDTRNTTSAFVPSVTPDATFTDSLIVQMWSENRNQTASAYAVANTATFTEQIDIGNAGGVGIGLQIATAPWSATTATGQGSATTSATTPTIGGGMFLVQSVQGGATGQIKVWNGSSFVAKPMKVWNGSSWATKPVKSWNGSSWVTTPY